MPKLRPEINDSPPRNASTSQGSVNKLTDLSVLKLIEAAMEEMVRFEMDEQHKIYDFREYVSDFLLTQFGLK